MGKEHLRAPELIIEGGTVLSMVDGADPLPDGELAIADGVIVAIQGGAGSPIPRSAATQVISAAGTVVLPGLINAHVHAAMTLFRGFADDLPLHEWLFEHIFPAEQAHLNAETVYWGALLGCVEMIASGTTAFVDGYFFQDETVKAVEKSGLRALVAQGVLDFPAPGVVRPEENLRVARDFVERWHGVSKRVTPGIFCHSPVTCSAETLKGAWEASRETGSPMQIHLSETSGEVDEIKNRTGKRPVHYLDDLGILEQGLVAAHGIHLDESELDRLAEKGVCIVHAPESNMKLASGAAPVADMIRRGITVGLGTDGCSSNNNLDLLQEMDAAAKLGKVFSEDPTVLDAATVFKMATAGGAACMGMGGEIGTLKVGGRADVVVLDLNAPHLSPVHDPPSAVVYSAGGSDVRDVIVDGRVLMRNRQIMTVDVAEVMGKVRELCRNMRR